MDVSPQFRPYSGVEILVDENTSFFAGNRSGRVLTIENAWGTQAQAEAIRASLTGSGFQYQPYRASSALLNPAAEIGDGVTANGLYSGIYKLLRRFSPQMAADIEAPQDEEIDHEYPYEPQQDRIYRREIAEAHASISLTQEAIAAEVTRATEAEGSLSSRIAQNATSISAKVSQTGGDNSSFGWSLLANKFSLFAGSKEVLKCTSSGIEVQGKITATSGYIGNGSSGFAIGATSMKNGMTSLSDTSHNGIYIGTDGIALGKGAFKVTASGAVSAVNMTLTGTLSVGGDTITAASLRQGAERANGGYSRWNGTSSAWSNATNRNASSYPSFFRCNTLVAMDGVETDDLATGSINGKTVSWKSKSVVTGVRVIRSGGVVDDVTYTAETITYLGR